MNRAGPLTRRYLEYTRAMEQLVPTIESPADWAPLAEYIAIEDFRRVGVFREVQDWAQYTHMLTRWAQSIGTFETTLLRATEVDALLYYEVEERHHRGEEVHVVNSMSVVEFGDDGKIHNLAIYLQQAP